MASFNLLTERWIPVDRVSGGTEELGLLAVLEQAHHLAGVTDPAPPMQFGLYRLLIAFIMDALQITELEDLAERLAAGKFDMAEVEAYADRVGRERFDLFHPERPFLQSPPTADEGNKADSVARLFFHLPGSASMYVTHFHHGRKEDHAVAPAVCARALCSIAPFMTAGGRGYSPSINGAPPWYVLIRGEHNLFETLSLNCYVQTDLGLPGGGTVSWRSGKPVVPGQEAACTSLPEGLTWQPRQVRLLPGAGGTCTYSGQASPVLVRQVVWGPGFRFSAADRWTDPQVAYKETDAGRLPLRPIEGRELWRDTGPLLLLRRADYASDKGRVRFARPLVVEQFRRMKDECLIPRSARELTEVYGMRTDNAKVFEWQYERLALPVGVGDNLDAGRQVQGALELAEGVAAALRRALKEAYPRSAKGNKKALDGVVEVAQAGYWSELRRHFDLVFLPALAVQDPNDPDAGKPLAEEWKGLLRKTGWDTLEQALDPLDADAGALARQVAARDAFRWAVEGLLNPKPAGTRPKKERRKPSA